MASGVADGLVEREVRNPTMVSGNSPRTAERSRPRGTVASSRPGCAVIRISVYIRSVWNILFLGVRRCGVITGPPPTSCHVSHARACSDVRARPAGVGLDRDYFILRCADLRGILPGRDRREFDDLDVLDVRCGWRRVRGLVSHANAPMPRDVHRECLAG